MTSKGSLILLHLPFDQHSKVHVRAGVSARDAISSILKKRNIGMFTLCFGKNKRSFIIGYIIWELSNSITKNRALEISLLQK